MKKILLTLIISITLLSASDFINDGAALTIDEGCTVTMDGDFEGTGTVELNGILQISGVLGDVETIDQNATSLIEFTGDGQTIPSDWYKRILLSGGGTKLLGDYVIIQYEFTIAEGSLNLNGGTLDFLGTGTLIETPGNVVFGEGIIRANFSMPSDPAFMNYVGLGLSLNIFDTGGVERGHTSFTSNDNTSISRWYSVTLAEGSVSDVIFRYDETELNGLDESSLLLFHSVDGENWDYVESTLDADNNTLSATGVDINGIFTASSGGGCTDPQAVNHAPDAFGDNGSCQYVIELVAGNNLISLHGVPYTTDVPILMADLECPNFLIGQGVGLFNNDTDDDGLNDTWSGNLNDVDPYSGYWINVCTSQDWIISMPAQLSDRCMQYELTTGNNLVSYIGEESPTLDALGTETENFNFVIGQGVGLFNTESGWSGNLNNLDSKKGYWVNISSSYDNFNWNSGAECGIPATPASVSADLSRDNSKPLFDWIQSTEQAFYLTKEILIDGEAPQEGDYLLAFHDGQLVGSIEYSGSYTPVPVMGKDVTSGTEAYPDEGDEVKLYLLSAREGKIVELEGSIPAWSSLGVYTLSSLTGILIEIPEDYVLEPSYPNPFNPSTTVKFGLPKEADISLKVYDLQGRIVANLVQGVMTAGYHTMQWNADNLASGVYFLTLMTKDYVSTQKLMLLK